MNFARASLFIAATFSVFALSRASGSFSDERGIAPEDVRSGYAFQAPDTQALQDDPFANPGLLWVDEGRDLWRRPEGSSGEACADCHRDAFHLEPADLGARQVRDQLVAVADAQQRELDLAVEDRAEPALDRTEPPGMEPS